ncbi:MAG: hypothetical protein KGL16_10710 [Acidobacteriota bacterium]|nr:hypothetical protein [Acidobacteriota bacterium]
MKRRLGAITALLCLCGTGAALAAGPVTGGPNTYTGSFSVAGAAGTVKRPAPVAMTQTMGMGSTTAGNVGAPLTVIRTTTYGVRAPNAKHFPTCTAAKINTNGNSGKWNGVCPKASLVGSGTTNAVLVPSSLKGPGTPCSLDLWVYNGGPGKLTFFFTVPTSGPGCAGLATGAAAAWTGTIFQAGKYLVTNVPEPADVSYNAGNTGLFGSLQNEVLRYHRVSVKKAGKVYPYLVSTGCTKRSRPYTLTYTATESNTGSPTVGSGTVKGTAKC